MDAFVIEAKAPASGGYAHVSALVIVNANSGKVEAAQVARWNDPPANG